MTEQLGEKVRMGQASISQGLKPNTHFVAFAAWLKPMPLLQTASSLSFHQAVKSWSDLTLARWFVLSHPCSARMGHPAAGTRRIPKLGTGQV
jgi:hypothetical protein